MNEAITYDANLMPVKKEMFIPRFWEGGQWSKEELKRHADIKSKWKPNIIKPHIKWWKRWFK